MAKTRLILIGGFLGAGKTTLMATAARRLIESGKRVGLVANDQAADLVDTELLRQTGADVYEVAGGCFCCRFPDLMTAMDQLIRDAAVDIVLAEPVGSCTDVSATVMQPVKDHYRGRFDLAPLSVLVDVAQVRALGRLFESRQPQASPRFPDSVLYIYEKQVEEADAIVFNKVDLIEPDELEELWQQFAARFSDKPIFTLSALTGNGVDRWLEYVCGSSQGGTHIAEVDYDVYAAGEAALGWMNASITLESTDEVAWDAFAGELLEAIRLPLQSVSAEIAHLKVFIKAAGGFASGNLTSNTGPISVRGTLSPSTRTASLLINARVLTQPDVLREVVETSLKAVGGDRVRATVVDLRSFFPARPQPTYRYGQVVEA